MTDKNYTIKEEHNKPDRKQTRNKQETQQTGQKTA